MLRSVFSSSLSLRGDNSCSPFSATGSKKSKEIATENIKEKQITKAQISNHPFITQQEYNIKFALGDIPVEYWAEISKNIEDFVGKWQVVLNKSDSIETIMKALNYNVLKRKAMCIYPAVTEINVTYENECEGKKEKQSNENEKNDLTYPIFHLTTYLPLGSVKKAVVKYNGKYVIINDNECGDWNTIGCYLDGRSLQRREGERGIMFDCRCVFTNREPGGEIAKSQNDSPTLLFRWTFIPHDTGEPIVVNRWFKKLK